MGQLEDILKHQNMVRNNIMKSFGAETSEDSLEKSFEDEVNPFEMEAYKSELTKAELDEFEKAKHQDGDMHPNGKWVWRQSANGGKGDWRVAKPSRGGSKATTGGASASAASTTQKQDDNQPAAKTTSVTKEQLDEASDGSKIIITTAQTGSNIVTFTKRNGKWYSQNTMTRAAVQASAADVMRAVDKYNRKTYRTNVNLSAAKKKTAEKSSYESKEADAYDKGDGKVGNYPVPTHTSYPAANLYSRLKNNRHFGFKYGLPEEEIMKKLKDYKGNVKVSYHNNAGTSEIYRIKFL